MENIEVISKLKNFYKGGIDESNTRDNVLYNDYFLSDECQGIATTIWASVDVIKECIEKGINLIIVHEALFWNHGDHIDWLESNQTFKEKKALLDEHRIVVWRNHDYIHSGIPLSDGTYVDGIFYGLCKEMDWTDYTFFKNGFAGIINVPKMKVDEFSKQMIEKLKLNGARIYGENNIDVEKIVIPMHIFSDTREEIKYIEEENVDLVLAMEIVDFTLSEYIIDSNSLNKNRAILSVGHFNLEEPGMKYIVEYLPNVLETEEIPIYFVKAGDTYRYV